MTPRATASDKRPAPCRAELHLHTVASPDGFTTVEDVLFECRRKQIGLVAFTEHDALALPERVVDEFAGHGITAVPGCEMTTDRGVHLIGLYIHSRVTGKSAAATVAHIHGQGGLVGIPHPFKPETGLLAVSPLPDPETLTVLKQADFLERLNGDWYHPDIDAALDGLARTHHLPLVAGSDSHSAWEVGRLVTELPLPAGPVSAETFARALRAGPLRLLRLDGFVQKAPAPKRGVKHLLSAVRHATLYRHLIRFVPYRLKRTVREHLYRRTYGAYKAAPGTPSYSPALDRERS